MQIGERRITVHSRSDKYFFHFLSDLHLGDSQCDEELIISELKLGGQKPNHYYFFGGDIIACIGHKDGRFLPSKLAKRFTGVDNIIDAEISYTVELISEYLGAGQIIGLQMGNHERAALKYYSGSPTAVMVKRLNDIFPVRKDPILNLGYHCFYRIWFKRAGQTMSFIIHAHHGWGSSRTAGGNITRYDRHAMQYTADIHAYGHVHDSTLKPLVQDVKLLPKKLGLKITNSWLLCSPPFQKTLSEPGETESWAETKGFPLRPLGGAIFAVKPNWDTGELKIHPTENF